MAEAIMPSICGREGRGYRRHGVHICRLILVYREAVNHTGDKLGHMLSCDSFRVPKAQFRESTNRTRRLGTKHGVPVSHDRRELGRADTKIKRVES